jgi:hypothetical protein
MFFFLADKKIYGSLYIKKGCEVDQEEIFIIEEVRWLMAL